MFCDVLFKVKLWSNRIHERGFHAVEDQRSQEDTHQHKAKGVQQVQHLQAAGAQKSVAEGLHDGRHRVEADERLEALRYGRDRVDNRGGVHQQ